MDVALQTGSQPTCARLVAYWNEHPELRAVFPSEDWAQQASELGPRSDSQGPCLALFTGVTTVPLDVNEWLVESVFHHQVRRVYWLDTRHPPCTTLAEVASAVAAHLASSGAPAPLRLQGNPRSAETELGQLLVGANPSLDLNPRQYETMVMVIATEQGYRWGTLPAAHTYKLAADETKRFSGSVATAVNKIHEALALVRALSPSPPQLHVAIDLGAAPGAWTAYLADHARIVVAVDPAALSDSALKPNVRHLRMRAENAIAHFSAAIEGHVNSATSDTRSAQGAGELLGERLPVLADLLVCDMNLHPAETTPLLKTMLPLLRPGGTLVYTLKFAGIARDRSASLTKLRQEFEGLLDAGHLVWLMANTVNERCYIARRQ